MDWDAAEDAGLVEPDGHSHFNALAAGAGYALYRHGQDRQTAQLLAGLRGAGTTTVNVTIDPDEDRKGLVPVNALDLSTAPMPKSFDDYVGQGPLKRQMQVHIAAANARGEPLPHTLFGSGMPGVGKTTMARLVAKA